MMMYPDDILLRVLRQFSRDMLLVIDPVTLNIVDASNELIKRLDYSHDQLTRLTITDIDGDLAAVLFWDEFKRGTEQSAEQVEGDFLSAGGELLPVSKTIRKFNENGREWILVEVEDNSRVQRERENLSKLSSQLKATLEASGDGIAVIQPPARIINMNHRFATMWGIPDEVLDRGNQAIYDQIRNELVDQSLFDHLLQNLGEYIDHDDRFTLELKNARVYELRVFAQISSDEVSGYVLNVHDITQHVQYEQALILERENAEQSSRYKSEFLSNMSHELRTPLNAILGFTQLMEMDAELDTTNREYVSEIHKAGNHLLDLINDVLDLTRVESGHIELNIEDVDIADLIVESLNLVRALADRFGIELHFSRGLNAFVRCDRKRMKQVLLNLLSNAIKYNHTDGDIYIDIFSHQQRRLSIAIRDTGSGIPREKLSQIFQPFNRLDADKTSIEGTGIGLTLTRRILQIMDGEITVDSEPGVGSTFTVHLPFEQRQSVRYRETPHDREHKGAAFIDPDNKGLPTLRVLVAEDVIPNQLVAKKLIEKLGHQVQVANNGEEAVNAVRENRFDLVFMDMRMPLMDGLTATREIRILEGESRCLPIIAMTANATSEDKRQCLEAGMNDFISKPINRDQLSDTLRMVARRLQDSLEAVSMK